MTTQADRRRLGTVVKSVLEARGYSANSVQAKYAPARGPFAKSTLYRIERGEDDLLTPGKLRKLDSMLDLGAGACAAVLNGDTAAVQAHPFPGGDAEAIRALILDLMVTPGVAKKVRRAR